MAIFEVKRVVFDESRLFFEIQNSKILTQFKSHHTRSVLIFSLSQNFGFIDVGDENGQKRHLKFVANKFCLQHSSPTSMWPKFSEKEGFLQVVNTK